MPHLHLSSLVTKKKNRDHRYIFSFHLALMHISLPRTPVIYNKMCTSLPRPYPSVRPSADSPLVHTAAAPDPTDAAAARTDATAGKTGTPTEHPATARPTPTTCNQPPRRHHTKRRGAIYDARRPAGRNHRRTQHAPRRHAQDPATVRAADILPPTGGNGRHKWRPYDTPTPREPGRAKPQTTQHARGGLPNTRDCPGGRHLAACGRQRAS